MDENKKLKEQLNQIKLDVTRLRNDIDVLLEIAAVIGRSLNLESAVSNILDVARKVIPYDMASLQMVQKDHLQVIGGIGFLQNESIRKLRFPYPEEGSLSTYALQSEKPVLSKDVRKDFPKFIQPPGEPPILSWMGIPLIMNNEPIGLISLDSFRIAGFSEYHLKLAELIANPLAMALENARIHERIFHMAMTDALTSLGSRYRFEIEGRLILEMAKRSNKPLSLVMLDIDKFKTINDNYGHKIGDEILRLLADHVSQQMSGTDFVSRLGGDEFVFLFPETDEEAGVSILSRIAETWSKISHSGIQQPITLSFGIYSKIPDMYTTLDMMMHRADLALYESKRNGRNRISVYHN